MADNKSGREIIAAQRAYRAAVKKRKAVSARGGQPIVRVARGK